MGPRSRARFFAPLGLRRTLRSSRQRMAVLEALGGSGPTENGHELVAAVFRVLSVNALPENMSGRTIGFEVMLVIEDRSELADFERLGGGANVEGGIRVDPRGSAWILGVKRIMEVIAPLRCKIRATWLYKELGSRSGKGQ